MPRERCGCSPRCVVPAACVAQHPSSAARHRRQAAPRRAARPPGPAVLRGGGRSAGRGAGETDLLCGNTTGNSSGNRGAWVNERQLRGGILPADPPTHLPDDPSSVPRDAAKGKARGKGTITLFSGGFELYAVNGHEAFRC